MFHVEMPVTLSLLVVFIILGIGFGASYYKIKEVPPACVVLGLMHRLSVFVTLALFA